MLEAQVAVKLLGGNGPHIPFYFFPLSFGTTHRDNGLASIPFTCLLVSLETSINLSKRHTAKTPRIVRVEDPRSGS